MNKLLKMLPALALVLGATLAMGMNLPNIVAERTATRIWTPDLSEPDDYRDVTEIYNNNAYDCDLQSVECVVEFSNDDPATGIKNVLETGVFSQM